MLGFGCAECEPSAAACTTVGRARIARAAGWEVATLMGESQGPWLRLVSGSQERSPPSGPGFSTSAPTLS